VSNADKALRHNLRRLEELIWILFGGGGSPSSLGGPWITVTHAASPYAAKAGERKFLVDSTAGPVTVNLNTLPDGAVVIVKDWKGQSGINPITVTPKTGTIENPSNAGNQAASGVINAQGFSAMWQNVASLGQLVEIV
jgi:hypothetical protein